MNRSQTELRWLTHANLRSFKPNLGIPTKVLRLTIISGWPIPEFLYPDTM